MNDLCKTKLSFLLKGSSETITNGKMQQAYENFIRQAQHLNRSENDYNIIFRTLSFTRIDYESLQAFDLWD